MTGEHTRPVTRVTTAYTLGAAVRELAAGSGEDTVQVTVTGKAGLILGVLVMRTREETVDRAPTPAPRVTIPMFREAPRVVPEPVDLDDEADDDLDEDAEPPGGTVACLSPQTRKFTARIGRGRGTWSGS